MVERMAPPFSSILSSLPKIRGEKREGFQYSIFILFHILIAFITTTFQADEGTEEGRIMVQNIRVDQVINRVYYNNIT